MRCEYVLCNFLDLSFWILLNSISTFPAKYSKYRNFCENHSFNKGTGVQMCQKCSNRRNNREPFDIAFFIISVGKHLQKFIP